MVLIMKEPFFSCTYIVIEDEAWTIPWLRSSVKNTGKKFLLTKYVLNEGILDVVTEECLDLIVFALPSLFGRPLFEYITTTTKNVRDILPSATVVFASTTGFKLNDKTLPPFVYIVTENNCDLISIIDIGKKYRNESNWEVRNVPKTRDLICFDSMDTHESCLKKINYDYCIANINIKHASMLLPCALASSLTGKVISCEISPQEAALFHLDSFDQDSIDYSIGLVFEELKNTVDELNDSIGSKLLLHLDHCDDFDILNSACKIGFNSVMADGSNKTLEQNIQLMQRARSLAHSFGIPIEGEIGYMDEKGMRKWGKTTIEDFVRFITATEVDYVGIHIGQYHGFDYGFSTTRKNLAEISYINKYAQSSDCCAFVESCYAVDKDLCNQGFGENANERRLLSKLADQILTAESIPGINIDTILNETKSRIPLYQQPLIDRVEAEWLGLRLKRSEQKKTIWQKMFGVTQQPIGTRRKKKPALIDYSLLRELSIISEENGSQLVIHGGSSLERKDLEIISKYNVARVNFGSDVFYDYLSALTSELPMQTNFTKDITHSRIMHFLKDSTRYWETWKKNPPPCIKMFAKQLAYKYVLPLSHNPKVVEFFAEERAVGKKIDIAILSR